MEKLDHIKQQLSEARTNVSLCNNLIAGLTGELEEVHKYIEELEAALKKLKT